MAGNIHPKGKIFQPVLEAMVKILTMILQCAN
jgi:hypothetical protein